MSGLGVHACTRCAAAHSTSSCIENWKLADSSSLGLSQGSFWGKKLLIFVAGNGQPVAWLPTS